MYYQVKTVTAANRQRGWYRAGGAPVGWRKTGGDIAVSSLPGERIDLYANGSCASGGGRGGGRLLMKMTCPARAACSAGRRY